MVGFVSCGEINRKFSWGSVGKSGWIIRNKKGLLSFELLLLN